MYPWRCRRAIDRDRGSGRRRRCCLNPGRHGEVAGAVVDTGYIAVVPRVVHAIFVVAQYFVVEAELVFVLTADFGNQYGFGAFELEGGRNRYVLVHYVGVAAGEIFAVDLQREYFITRVGGSGDGEGCTLCNLCVFTGVEGSIAIHDGERTVLYRFGQRYCIVINDVGQCNGEGSVGSYREGVGAVFVSLEGLVAKGYRYEFLALGQRVVKVSSLPTATDERSSTGAPSRVT